MVKYCKVKINKKRTEEHTSFLYPEGFKAEEHCFILYQNKGLETEAAISIVSDKFKFDEDNYVELTKKQSEELIDNWIEEDKDIKISNINKEKYNSLEELKEDIKQIKKNAL